MRRWLVVLVVALAVGVGAGAWWWFEVRAQVDPLPALTKDNATRAYLVGEGAVVTEMFVASRDLVASDEGCGEAVMGVVAPLGSPEDLVGVATGVPDPTARDLAVAQVGLLTQYATACGDPETVDGLGVRLVANADSFDELLSGQGARS